MQKKSLWAVMLAGLAAVAPAVAQDMKIEKIDRSQVPGLAPTFSDADMTKVAGMLTGSWRASVAAVGGDAKEVVVSFAPVRIDGIPNAIFSETAESGALNRPFRQTVLQLYRAADGLRIRTLEPRRSRAYMGNLAGLWAVPAAFPNLGADEFVATLDYVVTLSGTGFTAKTPHAYPTSTAGAFSMSSEIKFEEGVLSVADRGFDATGAAVWGPASGTFDSFKKFDSGVKATDMGGGLFLIEFKPGTGEPAKEGDVIKCHYAGYLEDGRPFDSSYDRGTPFAYPFGQPLIEGWNKAMAVTHAGSVRRLVIPGNMAYGAAGRKPIIPGDATLIFDIEVLEVAPPPAPATPDVGNTKPDPEK